MAQLHATVANLLLLPLRCLRCRVRSCSSSRCHDCLIHSAIRAVYLSHRLQFFCFSHCFLLCCFAIRPLLRLALWLLGARLLCCYLGFLWCLSLPLQHLIKKHIQHIAIWRQLHHCRCPCESHEAQHFSNSWTVLLARCRDGLHSNYSGAWC